jgi:hypothetical protein
MYSDGGGKYAILRGSCLPLSWEKYPYEEAIASEGTVLPEPKVTVRKIYGGLFLSTDPVNEAVLIK